MANVPLKSIKFPGLSDTYTVPQIDNTLATAGKAADAKAAGDIVKVSSTQPTEAANKLWVKDQPGNEYTVPLYSEFEELKSAVDDVTEVLNYFRVDDDDTQSITLTNTSNGVVLNGTEPSTGSDSRFEFYLDPGTYYATFNVVSGSMTDASNSAVSLRYGPSGNGTKWINNGDDKSTPVEMTFSDKTRVLLNVTRGHTYTDFTVQVQISKSVNAVDFSADSMTAVDLTARRGLIAVDDTLTQTGDAADAKVVGDRLTDVENLFVHKDMTDAEVYQVNTGSVVQTDSGKRLRILFQVQEGDYIDCISEYGSGVNIRLYSTKSDAVYSGNGYLQEFNTDYTTNKVTGVCNDSGWLVISEKKTDGTAITADEKQAMLAATTAIINGRYYQVYESTIGNVTANLNEDMDTALVGMSRFNTKKSGGSVTAVGYKKNLSFAVISDIHGSSNALTRFVDYVNAKKKYFDFALCLGDTEIANPSQDISWFAPAIDKLNVPFFYTPGNHDIAYTGSASITESEARTRYFAKIEEKDWLESTDFVGSGKCSWVKDFSDYSVRVISLYEYGNSETLATGALEAHCTRWMDSELLQWFADELYSTPAGYGVIVLLHQVTTDNVTYIDDKFTAISAFRAEPPHFFNSIDGNPVEEIVNAFMTSTAISKTYNSIASYSLGKTASVSKDFSGRSENGKFICYLCGHAHTAYVLSSQDYPNQKTIVVNTGSENIHQRSYGDINYDPNTRNRDSFYCFGIDTDRQKINVVQIGGQITDDLRKRDFTSISYAIT